MPTLSKSTSSYELTFIIDEQANQADSEAKAAQIKEYIQSHGGTFTSEELWGRRELAYPIKKNRSGFYVTYVFTLPGTELDGLDRELRFDERIIRHLLTKAYTSAQPGTLSPVVEEAATEKPRRSRDEKGSAEEMLRRSSGTKGSKSDDLEDGTEELSEEERMKQLDDTLEEMLKEEPEAA